MGLFISQKDQRSELQERIAADLREKAKQSALQEGDGFDDTRDSAYFGGHQTNHYTGAGLAIDFGVGGDYCWAVLGAGAMIWND